MGAIEERLAGEGADEQTDELSPQASAAALDRLRKRIGVRVVDPEAGDCLRIANRLGLSGYDAAYLALAEAVEGKLWTGDRRLFDRVKDRTAAIRWIGDYAA